jgi:hypothetical protein
MENSTTLEKLQTWEQMYGFVKDHTNNNPSATLRMDYEDIINDEDEMYDYFISWLGDEFEGDWQEELENIFQNSLSDKN